MSDGILDRDVLAKIGSANLKEAGFDGEVLKQWRRRGLRTSRDDDKRTDERAYNGTEQRITCKMTPSKNNLKHRTLDFHINEERCPCNTNFALDKGIAMPTTTRDATATNTRMTMEKQLQTKQRIPIATSTGAVDVLPSLVDIYMF